MSELEPTRRQLLRWVGWFFFFNSLLAFSAIFYYHAQIPDFSAVYGATTGYVILAWIFFVLCFWVQCATILFFGAALCALIALFSPHRYAVYPFALLFSAIVLILVAIDAVVYVLFHQHYFSVGVEIVKSGALSDVLVFGGLEKFIMFVVVSVFVALEYLLGVLIWKRVKQNRHTYYGYFASGALVVSTIFVYGLMIAAARFGHYQILSPVAQHEILKASRLSPYFTEVFDLLVPGEKRVRHVYAHRKKVPVMIDQLNHPLHYPLQPLLCRPPKKPYNVVIIAIDTWRYTAMNPKVTPNIDRFAKQSMQFMQHYSGGNCTRPGIFSLFYGLPGNYWEAFLDQRRPPVLIQTLLKEGYQMGIYASAPLNFPAFNRTVFSGVKSLKVKIDGDSSIARDKTVTKEFATFLKKRNRKKPFFGFLFYDAVHNYCESTLPAKTPFRPYVESCNRFSLTPSTPRQPYLNRYRNAVYFDDAQVGKVLAMLKNQGLLKNTIVIITADHGEQLNDEKRGLWIHASAYTKYQLHVPFIVHWPGRKAKINRYFTTHDDVAPTLLSHVLHCVTSFSAYSEGQSLFEKGHRPLLIANSYGDYAVILPKRDVTRIYPNGDYQVDDIRGVPVPESQLDPKRMRTVFKLLNRFF